jgi:hypothetical protein
MGIRLVPVVLAGAVSLVPIVHTARAVAGEARYQVRRVAYQGRNRGPEQTERFSRSIKLSRNGSISVSNISGDIVVNSSGSGDTISIEALKRTRGGDLKSVQIDVTEAAGRIDVRTNYPMDRLGRGDHVWVDYTISVPASASVELHSISGTLKVTGVQGSVRGETVSGNVNVSATPRLERAKSVSGDIDLTDAASDGDITVTSISGTVRAKGFKARGLEVSTVSGEVTLSNVACERLGVRSMSGNVGYVGALATGGRYNLSTHSGSVRLELSERVGFELDATTFSGSVQSELPLTIGGADRSGRRHGIGNHSLHATFGDGSAVLTVRTFSGSITVSKAK